MNSYKKIQIAALVCLIVFSGCANQQPPQGGPVDLTTPEIIAVYPGNNTLNFKGDRIIIEFDRYIEERTLEESIFISPYVGDLEFDWSGKEVEITFSEKLRQNTTYVVNIGTDVKDRFRGLTKMAKAYTMAFSTGPDIDRGNIEGIVYPSMKGKDVSGVMIFAYKMDEGINPDTLNPMSAKPDFITQAGKSGDFFLRYIPFSDYRIFAVRDEYRNLVYDRETDEYGVQSGPVSVTQDDTLAKGIFMQLAKEDTSGPRLIKAFAQDRNHIIAEFSEAILASSVKPESFVVMDTIDQKSLGLITVYQNPVLPKSMIAVTEKQDSAKAYSLFIKDVTDSTGNMINPLANSLVFQGSSRAVNTKIRMAVVSIKDSIRNIDIMPVLTLTFSDAAAKNLPLDFISILDGKNQAIPAIKKRISDAVVSIMPEKELAGKTWYTLRAELQQIRDWRDSTGRDSTKVWRFETIDLEDMSSVEGTVTDLNTADIEGDLYVVAWQIGKQDLRYSTKADKSTGQFILPLIKEGQYVLQAFKDRNKNNVFDPGNPFPFKYSERMSNLSDTLKVRARWPLEGVIIQLK